MTPRQQRDAYLRIVERNLGMAARLLGSNHFEGTIFHCYHAMECAARAAVRARGEKLDFAKHGHKAAFRAMNRLYRIKDDQQLRPFVPHILSIVSDADNVRAETLYPDENTCITPDTRWSEAECREYEQTSRSFCEMVTFKIT